MEEKDFLSAMMGNEYGINVEQNNNSQKEGHKNYINCVKVISVILLILCVIGGLIISTEEESILYLIIACISGFISWSIVYGMACIVENTEK